MPVGEQQDRGRRGLGALAGGLAGGVQGDLDRVAGRRAAARDDAVERSAHAVAVRRRGLHEPRLVVERDDADSQAVRDLIDETLRRLAGGLQAGRGDVLRLHRAGVVGREDDRSLVHRHRDRRLRAGERDDQCGERERVEDGRPVAAPAGAAGGDRAHDRRRAEGRTAAPQPALEAHVCPRGEREEQQPHEHARRLEAHGTWFGR